MNTQERAKEFAKAVERAASSDAPGGLVAVFHRDGFDNIVDCVEEWFTWDDWLLLRRVAVERPEDTKALMYLAGRLALLLPDDEPMEYQEYREELEAA